MKRTSSLVRGGFTLIELLVVIAIIALLASLSIPAVGGAITKAQLAQAVSNARQIHIATTGAAADSSAQSDPTIGWPSDTSSADTGAFIQTLLDGGYLKFGDLKVFGANKLVYDGSATFVPDKHVGFTVWNVGDSDEGSTIFLTTRNVTISNNGAKSEMDGQSENAKKVFGEKGFVVFRKGGDGTYYLKEKDKDGNYGTDPTSNTKMLSDGGTVTKPDAN